MTRPTFAAATGFGVVIALGFIGFGCSSSNSSSGTGGATGTGGVTATGGATGTGGKTGSGGATGAGGSAVDAGTTLPMCANPAPGDKTPCDSNPSCAKNCGLNITAITTSERALKGCTCSGPMADGGMWSCPSTNGACMYPTDIDLSCFHLPSPVPLCSVGGSDGGADGGGADGGAALIKSGTTACALPNSEVCGNVCGSATVNTYLDGSNNQKMGYCACIGGFYQCASVNEWPPQ